MKLINFKVVIVKDMFFLIQARNVVKIECEAIQYMKHNKSVESENLKS